MTRLGGVREMRSVRRIQEEGDGSGSGIHYSGLEVGARLPKSAGFGVRAGELKILYFWISSTTLQ